MSMWSVPSRRRLASAACMIHFRERPRPFGPGPIGFATLVAKTHAFRSAAMAPPVTSSDRPSLYASAVSMKLIPASRARSTMRLEVASFVCPPNIIVPRQMGETFKPDRPR